MRQPLVSVIMPAYNGEKYIRDAIFSVLNQTYVNFELIVVEDCSTDNTLNIIKKIHDKRLHLFCNTENKGISYSLNLGISNCKGKYIALLDDDDYAAPKRLEYQVAFMEDNGNVDILGGRSAIIDKDGDFIGYDDVRLSNPKFIKANLLFHKYCFANCTTMIRKRFLEQNNLWYREGYLGMQDFKFLVDSSKVGIITSIDRLLLFKRVHEEEASWYYLDKYKNERAKVYASLQRESIKKSGFDLSEEDLQAINDNLKETGKSTYSFSDVKALLHAFSSLIEQGEKMKVDYLQELKIACSHILGKRVFPKSDVFHWLKNI